MTAHDEQWRKADFSRRHYHVDGEELDKAKTIELIVRVDGQQVVRMQAREPGILAFVSKPDERGFDIELVQPGGLRYTDMQTAEGASTEPVAPWQLEALGIRGD